MYAEIKAYKELDSHIRAFKNGTYNLICLVGNRGQGKSKSVENILGKSDGTNKTKKPLWIKGGNVSAFEIFMQLHENRDRDLVFDDCDSLYSDRTAVRLLKSLCETDEVKKVGWWTRNKEMEATGTPKEFETRSRVVIILNHWNTANDQVEALEDRGLLIYFNPSFDEVLANGKKWFRDQEIVEFVESCRDYIVHLSLRAMVVASEMKRGGLPWKDILAESLGVKDVLLVKKLIEDQRYLSMEERAKVFESVTTRGAKKGASRATFYRLKKHVEDVQAAVKAKRPKMKAIYA